MDFRGSYRFLLDGQEVASSKNIITTTGKETIKRFLAGNIVDWCGGMAVGAISTAASTSDTALYFEIDREKTLFRSFNNNKIIVKASFPNSLDAIIREVGIFPIPSTTSDNQFQDAIISNFSNESGSSTTNSSVGTGNIVLSSGTTSFTKTGLSVDLTGYSSVDKLQLLAYNSDSNVKTIKIDMSDGSTTYSLTFPNLAASSGYQVTSVALGSPTISKMTEFTISVTSTNKSVELDCLKFLNTDQINYISGVVSRSVLGSPITKLAGQDLEVEYTLDVL
jgi:hypothetical protein